MSTHDGKRVWGNVVFIRVAIWPAKNSATMGDKENEYQGKIKVTIIIILNVIILSNSS